MCGGGGLVAIRGDDALLLVWVMWPLSCHECGALSFVSCSEWEIERESEQARVLLVWSPPHFPLLSLLSVPSLHMAPQRHRERGDITEPIMMLSSPPLLQSPLIWNTSYCHVVGVWNHPLFCHTQEKMFAVSSSFVYCTVCTCCTVVAHTIL